MKRNYLLIILASVFLAACSSGQKRLEHGDYNTAVYKAVKRLNQKPNHPKAEKVLRLAYTLAVNSHMDMVRYHDLSDTKFKYDGMVREYELVDHLNRAIRRYPLYQDLITLTDVTEELSLVRNHAAESHLLEGKRLLAIGTKNRARDAYYEFLKANDYVNGTASVALIDKAHQAGTVNVTIEFNQQSNFFKNFNTEQVFSNISNDLRNTRYRFLRIVDPAQSDIVPDEFIQVEMEDAQVGGVNFSKRLVEVTRDDVYMGEVETDSGEVIKVYGTVTANYLEFCKTINSRARVMLRRVDGATYSVLQTTVIPSQFNWTEKWATYRGDKRALSDNQLDMATRREPMPPNPDWLFAQASRPLVGSSLNFIRNQYRYLQ